MMNVTCADIKQPDYDGLIDAMVDLGKYGQAEHLVALMTQEDYSEWLGLTEVPDRIAGKFDLKFPVVGCGIKSSRLVYLGDL